VSVCPVGATYRASTSLWGFVSFVSETRKEITATVKLNSTHASFFGELAGEWQVRLIWCPNLENPWVLTELVPLGANSAQSYEKLKAMASEKERQRGRKVEKVANNHRSIVLLGEDNSFDARVLVKAQMSLDDGTLLMLYEDGGEDIISDLSQSTAKFRQLLEKNLSLKAQGKSGIPLQMSGVDVVPLGVGDSHLEDLN